MNKTTLRNPDNVLIKKMLDLDILTEYETKTYIKPVSYTHLTLPTKA